MAAHFDLDGNMLTGPVAGVAGASVGIPVPANAELTWDAENRLIKAVVGGTTINYAYDHLSRLISRSVGVSPTTSTHYLYDGWNRIAEYSDTTLEKTYLWGMDLSGTMQGAGGVGGLLSVKSGSTVHYPTFDGNGNVSEYLDGNGALAAHFEYDPFGNLVTDSQGNATAFPYRFSTKPQDATTGLYYYGYRYYDPGTGRWPSRDLIEEQGGVNLYGFVGNKPCCYYDKLGNEATMLDPTKSLDDGKPGFNINVYHWISDSKSSYVQMNDIKKDAITCKGARVGSAMLIVNLWRNKDIKNDFIVDVAKKGNFVAIADNWTSKGMSIPVCYYSEVSDATLYKVKDTSIDEIEVILEQYGFAATGDYVYVSQMTQNGAVARDMINSLLATDGVIENKSTLDYSYFGDCDNANSKVREYGFFFGS